MKKNIGLTYDLKTDWIKSDDDPVDINAELDSPLTVERITKALEAGGYRVKHIGHVYNLLENIENLKNEVDLVFNICEGKARARSRESQVPLLLEMYGIPFVGTDAIAQGVTLDKVFTKKIFVADGIPTPKFFVATPQDDLKKLNTIGFPLIVKTRHEGTSKGLTKNSRVEDTKSLEREVRIISENYHQSALVEEFIRGTEFTVPVIGNSPPQAMTVTQVSVDGNTDLMDQFFTFELVSYRGLTYVCPAKISSKLTKALQDLAVQAYRSVECRDLGRVDIRVDEKGDPYVLEINPLPSLAENDVFNIFPETVGKTYNEIIHHIVNAALERYGLMGGAHKKEIKYSVLEKTIH